MAAKRLADRKTYKGKVLTLRMSEQEMLKFKLAAIAMGKKRAEIVRDRVADLIGGPATAAPTNLAPADGNTCGTVAEGMVAALVEVQEAGSIARAAGDDPVRQSLYSRQLKELSEFFEVELTRRQGRGLALTPAGERVAHAARQAFEALNDASAVCRGEPVHYTIGAGDSLIRWLLLEKVGRLQDAVPNVSLGLRNMRTVEVVRGLQDLSVDFGIVRDDALSPNLSSRPLGRMEYALYVPKGMIPARIPRERSGNSDGRKVAERHNDRACRWALRHCPLAGLYGSGEFQERLLEGAAANGIDLQFRLKCDAFPAMCRAVATGRYAAVLPVLAKAELAAPGVVELRSPMLDHGSRRICLAWNPRMSRLRPIATRLTEEMSRALRF